MATTSSIAQPTSVTLGCADPKRLAAFYQAVTGWEVIYSGDDAVYLSGSEGMRLGCERSAGFEPPTWDRTQVPHARIDLAVEDLAETERRLLGLGATRPGHDRDTEHWIFLADPIGHPLCVTTVS